MTACTLMALGGFRAARSCSVPPSRQGEPGRGVGPAVRRFESPVEAAPGGGVPAGYESPSVPSAGPAHAGALPAAEPPAPTLRPPPQPRHEQRYRHLHHRPAPQLPGGRPRSARGQRPDGGRVRAGHRYPLGSGCGGRAEAGALRSVRNQF